MIDHRSYQLALRDKLLTLEVVTTGSTSLGATSTGYSRASGSFLTDGFAVGMEVVGNGFIQGANNEAKTITAVTALALTCAGRTISVGLPELRAWENVPVTPVTGRPYIREQYIPGPLARETLGAFGRLEARPMYGIGVYGVTNTGLGGVLDYADALLTLFAPGTAIVASNGDTLRVRSDTAPFRGQLMQHESGWAMVLVTVPLRVRTTNSI
jgi:hypothetical protein